MPKKILELCLSPDLGGLELFSYHCYRAFSKKTEVYFALQKAKKLDNYFEDENKLYLKRSKLPLMSAWQLAHFIDKKEIDIIHFHWTKDMLIAVLARLFSKRKPKIVQSRHMRMTRFKSDFYHKWLYSNIRLIHAVTKAVAEQLEHYIPREIIPKIAMVYLGVEPKEKKDICKLKQLYNPDNNFLFGIVGRIEKAKGQESVIEALYRLENKSVKLLIVGSAMDSAYLEYLQKKVEKLALQNQVIFVGFTKEVDAFMQLCNATVMATENETFGLVVIESMANNTPVIAKALGGPLEIIDDGVDGLLYDGSIEDLTAKMQMLLSDTQLVEALGKQGREKVREDFDFNKQLEKLYKVINES
jgi:glycosyltransferase involved in cell wall biosynthesis